MVVVGVAAVIKAVPDRDRHAEETLPGNQPVTVESGHPVLVADPHVVRMPVQFATALDQLLAQFVVAAAVAQVPLPGGHDFQWPFTLFEELHRMGDRARFTMEVTAFLQQLHHVLLGGEHRGPRQLLVSGLCGLTSDPTRHVARDPAIPANDWPGVQVQFPPPGHVGGVAEGADHGDAGALFRVCQRMRHHRHLHTEHWSGDGAAEQPLVTLIVGMRHQRDASGQQLGASGFDEHWLAVGAVEGHPVVGARSFPILQLCLRDSGAEGDIPQCGCFALVGLASFQVAQESQLRGEPSVAVDRLVGLGPVHADAQMAPQRLKLFLVLFGELLTQVHEVAATDRELPFRIGLLRRSELRVIGQARVAADAEVVLHPTLRGQAVVIPPHRVEHRFALHPLIAGDAVGVRVGEHVTHVQRTADRRRRSVDAVDLRPIATAIKPVELLLLPVRFPLVLQPFK